MKFNGMDIALEGSMSLEEFLLKREYVLDHIAVERNGEIVSKSIYGQILLSDDDVIEVVRFVGGG